MRDSAVAYGLFRIIAIADTEEATSSNLVTPTTNMQASHESAGLSTFQGLRIEQIVSKSEYVREGKKARLLKASCRNVVSKC